MKEGFMAMVAKRNSSEPSGLAAPKASLGSSVALQQIPTRSQLRMRRLAWLGVGAGARARVRVRVRVRARAAATASAPQKHAGRICL